MDCGSQTTTLSSKEIAINKLQEDRETAKNEVATQKTFLQNKKDILVELNVEIDTVTAQLGKTRSELKKTRRELTGVIGGFGASGGLILVAIGVVLYLRRRSRLKSSQATADSTI
tara:strand:- start:1130 stop:1474 length:345 start_codon:yes stop_codon:yes gene_type:complete